MAREVFSLRMRAAQGGSHEQGGRHISGAERIITAAEIKENINNLIDRAREHKQGSADYLHLTLEKIDVAKLEQTSSLSIRTVTINDYQKGRREAKKLLLRLGIKEKIINKAQHLLATGASPNGDNMRGAILMDLSTGKRLEPDHYRGVRVSRMDYTKQAKDRLINLLQANNLNQTHLPEALALATKVVGYPKLVAELCWSDDPNYTAGYVASKKFGYCRLPQLKPAKVDKGGRVFFVKSATELEKLITYLEKKPVLINQLDKRVNEYNSVSKLEEITNESLG